jgi:hypothetical protein
MLVTLFWHSVSKHCHACARDGMQCVSPREHCCACTNVSCPLHCSVSHVGVMQHSLLISTPITDPSAAAMATSNDDTHNRSVVEPVRNASSSSGKARCCCWAGLLMPFKRKSGSKDIYKDKGVVTTTGHQPPPSCPTVDAPASYRAGVRAKQDDPAIYRAGVRAKQDGKQECMGCLTCAPTLAVCMPAHPRDQSGLDMLQVPQAGLLPWRSSNAFLERMSGPHGSWVSHFIVRCLHALQASLRCSYALVLRMG